MNEDAGINTAKTSDPIWDSRNSDEPPSPSQEAVEKPKCHKCNGRGTIRVLGGGGDYEDWSCPVCRKAEYDRDIPLIYGGEDGEAD